MCIRAPPPSLPTYHIHFDPATVWTSSFGKTSNLLLSQSYSPSYYYMYILLYIQYSLRNAGPADLTPSHLVEPVTCAALFLILFPLVVVGTISVYSEDPMTTVSEGVVPVRLDHCGWRVPA